jgi:hypothetical protein
MDQLFLFIYPNVRKKHLIRKKKKKKWFDMKYILSKQPSFDNSLGCPVRVVLGSQIYHKPSTLWYEQNIWLNLCFVYKSFYKTKYLSD